MRYFAIAAFALILATPMRAQPALAVKVTNLSKENWRLRANEDPTTVVLAQGASDPAPVELNAQKDTVVYCLSPGESCLLQFNQKEDLPTVVGLGVVDASDADHGQIVLADKPGDDNDKPVTEARLAECFGLGPLAPMHPFFDLIW
jgi:hypothetical protein